MVEVLNPGDSAEICRMPAASGDLNGLKGVVVRYDESKGRYTFELDESGEIMSLRANNLKKPCGDKPTETASKATQTTYFFINDLVNYTRPNGDKSIAKVIAIRHVDSKPNYGISLLETNVEKNVTGDCLTLVQRDDNAGKNQSPAAGPSWIDQMLFSMCQTVSEMNPSTILVIILAIILIWPSGNVKPDEDGDYYYPPRSYHWWGHWWGHWGWYHHWSWGVMFGGLGSFVFLMVYARKLGTDNGRRSFDWDRAWQKVMEMDFWQLVRLAGILEVAFHFVGNLTAGGRRRR